MYVPVLNLLGPLFTVILKDYWQLFSNYYTSPGFPSSQHLKRAKFRRFWSLFPPSLWVAQLHWLGRSGFAQWQKRLMPATELEVPVFPWGHILTQRPSTVRQSYRCSQPRSAQTVPGQGSPLLGWRPPCIQSREPHLSTPLCEWKIQVHTQSALSASRLLPNNRYRIFNLYCSPGVCVHASFIQLYLLTPLHQGLELI